MLTLLHFADAHIDIAGHGRRDAQTNLPVRVLDFLKALDTIVDTAIDEKVDLVIFAGDAYKDRTPVPTFQREWGKRVLRLSQAGIPTLMLVGNHDLSPAAGRAHALQEFDTLQIPHIHVAARPKLYTSEELEGLPVQIMALPWVSRSGLMAALELNGADIQQVYTEIEERLSALIHRWLDEADPSLPVILAAHTSVQGAVYGGERSVMLGSDLVLPGSLVRDPRIDYAALGHIHKAQDLNEGAHPPVIYPGSIERVDFGEAADEKFFVIAQIERGRSRVDWRRLNGRRFIDRRARLNSEDEVKNLWRAALPQPEEMAGAIVRLTLEYPRVLEDYLDETELRRYAEAAFEFHLVRRPQIETRARLPGDASLSTLPPLDLLDIYWRSVNTPADDAGDLQRLASEIIGGLAED